MENKYKSLSDFKKDYPSEYNSLKYKKLLDKLCEDMGWEPIKKTKPNGYWTAETIFEESKKYKTPQEWKSNSSSSYSMSFKIDGLYEKCLNEMGITKVKPSGYWTAEKIFEESKKYKTPQEWKRGSSTSYSMSFKIDGLYVKCLEEMGINKRTPHGYWQIKENVLAKALEYKTKSEWGTGPNSCGSSYNAAKKYGWFEECTAHMVELLKPVGYWSIEKLLENAKNYEYYSDWLKNEKGAYQAAKKKNLVDACTQHMIFNSVKNGYWQIKENVLAEALKYKTRSEFSNKSSGAYNVAKINGWYDECTAHMEYAEGHTPAGFWTKEKVLAIAKNYDNRLDWVKNDEKSVNAARSYGWLDECLEHMLLLKKPPKYWHDKEKCLEDALKFKTKTEWQKNSSAAKKSAIKHGWYEECTAHMIEESKPAGYWTKENVLIEALKYKNKSDWRKNSSGSLYVAFKNKWVDECCKHMIEIKKPLGYWTKEKCFEEALKYNNRSEWNKKSCPSYTAAKKYGWFEECTAHMTLLVRPNGTWTKELLIIEAKKWKTLSEWRKFGDGYSRVKAYDCYDECTQHMTRTSKPVGFWNVKENVLVEALKFNSKIEWQAKSNGSMKSARKNGWLDECCTHMKKNGK